MPRSTAPMVVAPVRSRSVTEVSRMVSVPTTTNDAELAATLADEAGQLLMSVRTANAGIDPADLKDLGDRSSQELLAARLAELRPGDAVLSEEAVDDLRRLTADRVWIIDPLDGTREYSEGRHDWAVHVALWVRRRPGRRRGRAAGCRPGPVHRPRPGRARARRRPGAPLRMAVSRTRPPAVADELVARLGLEAVPMGSAGVQGRRGRPRRGRRLRARGRPVRVGLGGTGRRGAGRRPARLPNRRLAAALQPARRAPARPGGRAGRSWPTACSRRSRRLPSDAGRHQPGRFRP